jgi:UDP-sulfoquinovose synthase
MRILVLGGDGYLGWPTALHLSGVGHDVAVADNFARRGYDQELGVTSLVPIATLERRVAAWQHVSGHHIATFFGDLTDPAWCLMTFARTRSCTSRSSVRRPTR